MKSLHLLFFLAFIGHAHAQGIICGTLGILCPPTTVAPSSAPTTAQMATTTTTPASTEGTETICFEIPGSNVDVTIDPAQLTQGQIDQIQQILEDFLTGIPGNLTVDSENLLGGLLNGLGGILNPATTQAPGGGTGQLCLVLTASQIDDVIVLFNSAVNEILSRYEQFFVCVRPHIVDLTDIIASAIKEFLDEALKFYPCRRDLNCVFEIFRNALHQLFLKLRNGILKSITSLPECF